MVITLERISPLNASLFQTVRLAALQDSPNAFGSTYARESQFSEADWVKRATEWSSERSIGFLAMHEGSCCGIVAGFLDEHDVDKVHLISMWVAPPHRGKGVGRILVDEIRRWAEGRGGRVLRLTVTSNNDLAVQFYERNGFKKTGAVVPYRNDASLFEYEMVRHLANKKQ